MRSKSFSTVIAVCGLLFASHDLAAQGAQAQKSAAQNELQNKLDRLEREVQELRRAAGQNGGIGRGGLGAPRWFDREMLDSRIGYQEDSMASTEADRLKIRGRLDFEFYDLHANGNDLGAYRDGNQFGLSSGATEFRVRRMELGLGLELIEDFRFQTTMTLDPVVRDQDEGAVDLDEAYVRFGNVFRNFFGIEDPSHTFLQVGNYFRWERDFLNRWSESFSLAGTSFYRDEVTGLLIGGEFEEGLFYRLSIDNGSTIGSRDAGVGAARGTSGAVGNAPILHDNEQLGDFNNNKDVALGLGFRGAFEEPDFQYHAAISYREGRLAPGEQAFLSQVSTAYDGGSKKSRLGILGGFDWDLEGLRFALDAEFWVAQDGNGDREAWSIAPAITLPLDGVYYQKRLFFTGVGFGYRLAGLHVSGGLPNQPLIRSILDDRTMHTIGAWLDVTRGVNLRLELNNIEANHRGRSETEWLVQWSVSF